MRVINGPGSCGWKSTPPGKSFSTRSRIFCVSSTGAAWLDQVSTCACAASAVSVSASTAPARILIERVTSGCLVDADFSVHVWRWAVTGAGDEFGRNEPGDRLGLSLLDDLHQHAGDLACRVPR